MKKLDLGQTVTILANLGVIAGIVFLAYELRQNNALLRFESDLRLLENQSAAASNIIADPTLAEVFVKLRTSRLPVYLQEADPFDV